MENALELRGLTKKYPGFTLDSIDLTLPSGCIMGLVGENGAGKSTIIRLILNLIPRDGGSICVLGEKPINPAAFAGLREQLGIVLDEPGIPLVLTPAGYEKVLKNIYRNWDANRYFELMEFFSLPLNKPYKDFSKGMRMKLALAAALSHRPKLLILDEATSGLDPVARDDLLDLFLDFTRQEDHSILISSHIVSDLSKVCDYISFLHKGQMILSDEKDLLSEKYGIFQGTREDMDRLDREGRAVMRIRENGYGFEALVKRDMLPPECTVRPAELEELFVMLIKGKQPGGAMTAASKGESR